MLGKKRTMKRLTKNSLKKLELITLNLSKKKKVGRCMTDSKESLAAMKAQKENKMSEKGFNSEAQETMSKGISKKIKIGKQKIRRQRKRGDRVRDLSKKIQDVGFTINSTLINEAVTKEGDRKVFEVAKRGVT